MELYIHIPFCRKKCTYCSFTSYVGQEAFFERYIELVLKEAESRLDEAAEPIRTVYIGGGTPSLLPQGLLRKLTGGLKEIYDFSNVCEFTTEANPGTVTPEWLDCAAEAGINRISFGMQAYQDQHLALLGRIHRYEDVVRSVRCAREAGINNVSLDLIFGIPRQTLDDWKETLDSAISLKPDHISAYGLIPEEGTPLNAQIEEGVLELPDPETERAMYGYTVSFLREQGLYRYEISNFSRRGYECRHNIGYWSQVPYIGLGVSAASMTGLRFSSEGMSYIRCSNPASPESYRLMAEKNGDPETKETIRPHDARFETMMLGLRMACGVDADDFRRKHSVSLEKCYGNKLLSLEKNGLLKHEYNAWKLTERGFDIQNSVLVDLMD